MTLTKAIATVVGIGVAGGVSGAGLGWAIGYFTPTAYHAMLPAAAMTNADPIHIGIALGLAQGLLVGVAVGVILTALVTWYEIRTHPRYDDRNRNQDA